MSVTKDNGTTKRSLVVIALIVSAGLVLSSLLIIPYLTTNKSQEFDSQRRIISFEGTDLLVQENGCVHVMVSKSTLLP
jgi:hypothetical protein